MKSISSGGNGKTFHSSRPDIPAIFPVFKNTAVIQSNL
jgi:hypothetical protein